jgi:2-aminoadipate transaminase|tara:strand:+ start:618 stop:1901 length:1284 start_codon:yes stop_codon:yes gene_type:complete
MKMERSAQLKARLSILGERVAKNEPVITQLMTQALARPKLLSLAAGFTDNTVLPAQIVADSARQLLQDDPSQSYLQYGVNQGRPRLREQVVERLASYPGEGEIALGPKNVLISNGSQQSLYMSAQLFCDPGDIVLVEAPTYFVFLELLKGLGLRPVSMPTTASGGIDIAGLETLFADLKSKGDLDRVKLLYFMGVFANPSARSWLEEDKCALGRFVGGLGWSLPVIEDVAYRDIYYDEPWPSRTVLSLPEWAGLPAMLAGTFTKPYATGLKVGYAVSHDQDWIAHLARIKGHHDFGTANYSQALIEEAISAGSFERHLITQRAHYAEKHAIFEAALRSEGLQDLGWSWEAPVGGLLLWAKGPEGLDTSLDSEFWNACLESDVTYVPGDLCFAQGEPRNFVRLSFGVLAPDALREAVRRFVAAARRFQ